MSRGANETLDFRRAIIDFSRVPKRRGGMRDGGDG